MTDDEIREKLRALDEREDIEMPTWEAGFVESVVYRYVWPMTEKQRLAAITILEKYEVDSRAETITKLPPGAERYFRKP